MADVRHMRPAPAPCFGGIARNRIILRISIGHAVATTGVGRLSSIASGFCLAITVANEAEADRVFAALADGGKVQMPLGKTFFSLRFCIVADRLGVAWTVIVPT